MASKQELTVFAHHVISLHKMKNGDALTLCFFGGVRIKVVKERVGYFFDGEYVGNIHGAYQAYAELCASKERESES